MKKQKKRVNDLYFILDSITLTKEHVFDQGLQQNLYKAFLVNKCLSNFPDTLMHSNELNCRYHIPAKYQYDYYYHTVRKRKRYSPWHKKEKNENLKAIKEYFGISNRKAEEYEKMLSKEEIQKIIKMTYKGGVD